MTAAFRRRGRPAKPAAELAAGDRGADYAPITVQVPRAVLAALDALASRRDRSRAYLIREALFEATRGERA